MRELGVLPPSPREQAAKSPRTDRCAESPRALRPKSPRELRPKSPRSEAAVPRTKSPRGASNSVLSGHLGGSSQARMDLMAKEMEDMKKNLSLERRQRQEAESRINQLEQRTAASRAQVQSSRGRWALAPADANVKPSQRDKKSVHNRLYDAAMSPQS